jgi:MATE family multidrug resistance protein
MVADVTSVIFNIPLTWLLVFGGGPVPALGIAGAAWATVASGVLGVGVFALFYLEQDHRARFAVAESLRLDNGILRRWVRLGVPAGVEQFLNVAAFNLFLLMFQSYGIAESASAAIVFNWDIVSFVPMLGLNVAIVSLVGRYIGAGDVARTREVVRAAFVMGLGYSGVLATFFFLARVSLVELFVGGGEDDTAIVSLASTMMIGLALYAMADATILVTGGVLRGAGDTRWLMWASILLHWLMLLVQVLVIEILELGSRVSWAVFVFTILATAVVYSIRLYRGRWNTPGALARVLSEQ